ncbi:hypothetical protein LTR27_000344 [Elasticomyces elasticus]|nr:hypothetical protein LTR27_000344 [Elasticomyces elasticus]
MARGKKGGRRGGAAQPNSGRKADSKSKITKKVRKNKNVAEHSDSESSGDVEMAEDNDPTVDVEMTEASIDGDADGAEDSSVAPSKKATKGKFACPNKCGHTSARAYNLAKHVENACPNTPDEEKKKSRIECPNKCGADFAKKSDVTRHVKRSCPKTPKEEKEKDRIECPNKCGSDFSRQDEVNRHVNKFCPKTPKEELGKGRIECPNNCGSDFLSQDAVNRHVNKFCPKTKEEKEKPGLPCPNKCGSHFSRQGDLTRHVNNLCPKRSKEEKAKARLPCPNKCGSDFSLASHRDDHVKYHCKRRTRAEKRAALQNRTTCDCCSRSVPAGGYRRHRKRCGDYNKKLQSAIRGLVRKSFKPPGSTKKPPQLMVELLKLLRNQVGSRQSAFSHRPIVHTAHGSFQQTAVRGDGNCLFRTLAYLLFGHEQEWRRVRNMLAEHYAQATAREGQGASPLLNPALQAVRAVLYGHLQEQSRPAIGEEQGAFNTDIESQLFGPGEGYWATADMVQIAADAFNAEIFIHTATFNQDNVEPTWDLVVRGNAGASQQFHIVNYVDQYHWQPLAPTNAAYRFRGQVTDAQRDPMVGYDTNNVDAEGNLTGTVPIRIPHDARIGLGDGTTQGQAESDEDEIEETYEEQGDAANDLPRSQLKRLGERIMDQRGVFPTTPAALRTLTASDPAVGFMTAAAKAKLLPLVQFGTKHVLDFDIFSLGQTPLQREELNRQSLLRRQMWREDPAEGGNLSALSSSFTTPAHKVMEDDAEPATNAANERILFGIGEIVQARKDGSYVIRTSRVDEKGNAIWETRETNALNVVHAGPANAVFFLLGRFSDNRDAQTIAQALASHNVVLADYFISRGLEFAADPTYPQIPFPQQVHRHWFNDWSAANLMPVYDSPFVPPEFLQMQIQLDQLDAQPNPPDVYFLIRSLTGLSAARTWDRIRARWPNLRIRLAFALRDSFMVLTWAGIFHIRILQPGSQIPTANNFYYTREVDLNDLADAENQLPNADPACVELLRLFKEEEDARTGGMTWHNACTNVYPRGNDRNGFL